MKVDLVVTDDDGGRWQGQAVLSKEPAPDPDPVTPPDAPRQPIVPGVHDQRTPAELVRAFPGVVLTREFVAGIQNDPNDLDGLKRKIERIARPSLDAGLQPIVSVKFNVDQVLRGEWNATLRALGPWLIAIGVRRFIPWHEPEDDIDGRAFARYFKIVRECLRTDATELSVIYSAMAYQWAPKTADPNRSIAGRTDDVAAWASIDADAYAVDVYSGRSFPLGLILPEHPGFVRWRRSIIGSSGREWMVTERGFEAGPDGYATRAATIRRETDWLLSGAARGCVGYAYWATPGTESSAALDLDPAGEAAVRDLVARLAQ